MEQGNSDKKPGRYDFAKATWGEKLFAWSRQDRIGQALGNDVDSVFASIAEYDFTKKNEKAYQYLFWICRLIMKGIPKTQNSNGELKTILSPIKPEDIYKIKDNLELFLRVRKGLPEDKQDISKIGSAQELDDLVDPYQDIEVQSLGQLSREEREAILSETVFHYDGEHGKILTPLTKRAAIFWGQGTKWCFATTKTKNLFDDYKHSPLVIYITNDIGYRTVIKKIKDKKDGKEKEQKVRMPYQIRFAGHKDSDVKDSKDKDVESIPESLRNLVLHTGKIEFFIEHGSIKPIHFPPKTFDEEFIIRNIRNKNIKKLEDINKQDLTSGIYVASAEAFGAQVGLWNIPKDFWTKELYIACLNNSSNDWFYIPWRERDYDVCLAGVKANGRFLEEVPEEYHTEGMYMASLEKGYLALYFIPDDTLPADKADALYKKALKHSSTAITLIPEDRRTEEIYMIYIQGDWMERDLGFESNLSKLIGKPYYRKIMRLGLEKVMSDPNKEEKAKRFLAKSFIDVMSPREKKTILGITTPRKACLSKELRV